MYETSGLSLWNSSRAMVGIFPLLVGRCFIMRLISRCRSDLLKEALKYEDFVKRHKDQLVIVDRDYETYCVETWSKNNTPKFRSTINWTDSSGNRHNFQNDHVAFVLAGGNLIPNNQVHHKCSNSACVRPEHLVLVSGKDHYRLDYYANSRSFGQDNIKHIPSVIEHLRKGLSYKEISEQMGIPRSFISKIAIGKTHKHHPLVKEYVKERGLA